MLLAKDNLENENATTCISNFNLLMQIATIYIMLVPEINVTVN